MEGNWISENWQHEVHAFWLNLLHVGEKVIIVIKTAKHRCTQTQQLLQSVPQLNNPLCIFFKNTLLSIVLIPHKSITTTITITALLLKPLCILLNHTFLYYQSIFPTEQSLSSTTN